MEFNSGYETTSLFHGCVRCRASCDFARLSAARSSRALGNFRPQDIDPTLQDLSCCSQFSFASPFVGGK
jgi:hypothetical protein